MTRSAKMLKNEWRAKVQFRNKMIVGVLLFTFTLGFSLGILAMWTLS